MQVALAFIQLNMLLCLYDCWDSSQLRNFAPWHCQIAVGIGMEVKLACLEFLPFFLLNNSHVSHVSFFRKETVLQLLSVSLQPYI